MPGAARDSELVLLGAPFDVRRRPVDPQEHERRLPHELARLRVNLLLPDVRIPVLRGGDDAVGVRGPVDRGDQLVVLWPWGQRAICGRVGTRKRTSDNVTVCTHSAPFRV